MTRDREGSRPEGGEPFAGGPSEPQRLPRTDPMSDAPPSETIRRATPGYGGPDRRNRPTPRLSRYSFLGGRRHAVHVEEREGTYVDLYGAWLFFTIAWVALMNVGDSFFTLYHLQAGGIELNPIAQTLLDLGRTEFVLWKSVMISLALMVLCVHKNFVLAKWGLVAATATYTALFGWHLYLLTV